MGGQGVSQADRDAMRRLSEGGPGAGREQVRTPSPRALVHRRAAGELGIIVELGLGGRHGSAAAGRARRR